MGTIRKYNRTMLCILMYTVLLVTFLFIQSCKNEKKGTTLKAIQTENEVVIEIITEDMNFIAPDTIILPKFRTGN